MANDFITINQADSAAKFAQELKQATVLTKQLMDLYGILIARGSHMNNGGVFTEFETKHGLPAGQGQLVYEMIDGANKAMLGTLQNAQAVALKDRVG